MVWGYMAFSGGIASPVVLGSRSTHLRSGLGGIEGRALRTGDILPLGLDDADGPCLRPASPLQGASIPCGKGPIRLILGPQQDYFAPEIIARLTEEEFLALRSRSVTSNAGRGGRRYRPLAFTEHGAIMAATVLNSPRAVEMSVFVVRAFVRLRDLARTHVELARHLAALERRVTAHDADLKQVFAESAAYCTQGL